MMKPLFYELKNKEKGGRQILKNRIAKDLIPKLKALGFETKEEKIKNTEMKGLKIFLEDNPKKYIFAIPWVREITWSAKDTEKTLLSYPRLNIPRKYLHLSNDNKIQTMYKFVHSRNYYFLIMLPKLQGQDLYWLERYDIFPLQSWRLTFRKKSSDMNRIYFAKPNYHFVLAKVLKSQIFKILK